MAVQAKKIVCTDQGHVVADFADGHKLVFVYNKGGWGASTTIQTIRLDQGKNSVVSYNSPYQYPRNTRSLGMQSMAAGYNVKRFLEYIEAAMEAGRKKNDVWVELHKAHKDVLDLQKLAKEEG